MVNTFYDCVILITNPLCIYTIVRENTLFDALFIQSLSFYCFKNRGKLSRLTSHWKFIKISILLKRFSLDFCE